MTPAQRGKGRGDRWTILRRRDWEHDHGSLVPPKAPVPEPDDLLEVIEVAPIAEVERLREQLRYAIDALEGRPWTGWNTDAAKDVLDA